MEFNDGTANTEITKANIYLRLSEPLLIDEGSLGQCKIVILLSKILTKNYEYSSGSSHHVDKNDHIFISDVDILTTDVISFHLISALLGIDII